MKDHIIISASRIIYFIIFIAIANIQYHIFYFIIKYAEHDQV